MRALFKVGIRSGGIDFCAGEVSWIQGVLAYISLRLVVSYFFWACPPRFARGSGCFGVRRAPSRLAERGETAPSGRPPHPSRGGAPARGGRATQTLFKAFQLQIGIIPDFGHTRSFRLAASPFGLAASQARRPPQAGGAPKNSYLDLRDLLPRVGIRLG